MRDKTACFTGHRKIDKKEYPLIKVKLREVIIGLIEKGIIFYEAGGAIGFDTLAAKIVLELRAIYPQIKLILILPCKNQTRGWNNQDISDFNDILQSADKTVYTSEEYTRGCMFERNRRLVDSSSYCIAFLNNDKGGTAYTVKLAYKAGIEVINLVEDEQIKLF